MILSYLLSGVAGFSIVCSFLPAVIPLCYPYDCKMCITHVCLFISLVSMFRSLNLEDKSSEGLIGFVQT